MLSSSRILRISKQFLYSTTTTTTTEGSGSGSKRFKYVFDHGTYMIPHPAKAYKGGEDAFYVSDNVLAVADGVGGWADHGIDPGLYSKRLCELFG